MATGLAFLAIEAVLAGIDAIPPRAFISNSIIINHLGHASLAVHRVGLCVIGSVFATSVQRWQVHL